MQNWEWDKTKKIIEKEQNLVQEPQSLLVHRCLHSEWLV